MIAKQVEKLLYNGNVGAPICGGVLFYFVLGAMVCEQFGIYHIKLSVDHC